VVQQRMKEMSDRRFLDASGQSDISNKDASGKDKVLSVYAFSVCSFLLGV